jgi:hypothetical protein
VGYLLFCAGFLCPSGTQALGKEGVVWHITQEPFFIKQAFQQILTHMKIANLKPTNFRKSKPSFYGKKYINQRSDC